MTREVRATYRLQVRPGFTLDDAADLVPYLADLGVSHVYCSPLLTSATGSDHGYDVVDPTTIDPQRGGLEGLRRLADAAHDAGLGVVLDIVPNHLAVLTRENPWWWDVLRSGPASDHAHVFDIDWTDSPTGVPQVVLPVLGVDASDAVAAGDLRLVVEDGEPLVAYHDDRFPVRPGSLATVGVDEAAPPTDLDPATTRALLDEQHHRLVAWRAGADQLNYRRFFDVKSLGGVRIEDPDVFEATHRTVLDLVADGTFDGLRVDHPDGLRDPGGYARRLRDEIGDDAWLVFEKILEPGEELPDWPVDGTVGYDLARLVLGVLVDPDAASTFTALWDRIADGDAEDVPPVGHHDVETEIEVGKRLAVTELLGAEWQSVARRVAVLAEAAGSDATVDEVADVVRELVVAFPVYRTYVEPEAGVVGDTDRRVVTEAIALARARGGVRSDVLELLARLLVLDVPESLAAQRDEVEELVARFQQLTGPATAKGVEDTAWYRHLRFPALNEVGGDPDRFGIPVAELHEANRERAERWPRTMLTTSTHDTKRSEDVRARLAVLSEVPDLWVRTTERWAEACAPLRGELGPGAAMEHLAWHTAVGAWPISGERLADYLVKAARERKIETSWTDTDEAWESDLVAYAQALVDHEPFLGPLRELLDVVVPAGRVNSLAQTLVKLTSPGVPDVYQGCELWELSLVDPDNRRPVDFAERRRLLDEIASSVEPAEVWGQADAGLPKLLVTSRALGLRGDRADAFGPGAAYDPLFASGPRADHVIAFARGGEVVTVAPRLTLGLGPSPETSRFGSWDWHDTTLTLPPGSWEDVLTGRVHDADAPQPMATLLHDLPVALLTRR